MQFCFLYFETITHMMYVFNLIINIITYLNYNEIINLQIKHDLYLITFNIPRFQLFYNYGLFFFPFKPQDLVRIDFALLPPGFTSFILY